MKNLLLSCLIFSLCLSNIYAQDQLKIGQWKSHLPYSSGISVTQSNSHIYYASNWGLTILDKSDDSVDFMSKIDGLSDVGIEIVKYNQAANVLLAVYANSSIDLIREDRISTINDIPNANNLSGDRKVYDIYMANDSIAYLATGYGVSKLNLNREDIPASTIPGIKFTGINIFNGYIYAASDEGIYRTPDELSSNFEDFEGQWEYLDNAFGLPDDYNSTSLCVYKNELYFDIDQAIYKWDGLNDPQLIYEPGEGFSTTYIVGGNRKLIAGYSCIDGDACNGSKLFFINDDGSNGTSEFCVNIPTYALEDETGKIWLADIFSGFRVSDDLNSDCNKIRFNAPFSHFTNRIDLYNDQVWIASGGITPNQNYIWRVDGFFSLVEGQWAYYNRFNKFELANLSDFYDIVVNKENGTVYTSSYLDGLIEVKDGNLKLYNSTNSSLRKVAIGDTTRTRISGLAFDQENNLWVGNYGAANSFSVRMKDGNWKSFPSLPNHNRLLDVIVDRNGYKWFIDGGGGIVLFDEGEDINNTADDRIKWIGSSGGLDNSDVKSLALDLDGDVWVGTAAGVFVFECDPFDDACVASKRLVTEGDFLANLLETEDVRAIAIDGANRKWFGTTNGIFVQSADGREKIARFTTENSPLFDNTITDIAINNNTGEVFIGTNKGMISYRSDALKGEENHQSPVIAYPNPVRPEYDGPIAIKGLARDSNVKITDVNGQLMYETKALGGQAIWDGRDYTGRKASTGVYLVMATSSGSIDNPTAVVAKILFVN